MSRLILILVIGVTFLLPQVLFSVDETEYAITIQLGKPVNVIKEPGLNFKLPFVQTVIFFDNRILDYDAEPKDIISKDKKNMVVDNYAKWRIVDPLLFYQSVRNERGGQSRLDDIIYSELRTELGKHLLIEIISAERGNIMKKVTITSTAKSSKYGMEVLDVRIKRADLPPQNEKAVYQRMQAERERVAKRYRSEGAEESLKLRSHSEKEKQIILAEAYKTAQALMGEGDGKAFAIYEKSFKQDPELFKLLRSLEAYKVVIKRDTTMVLSPNSKFFQYLNGVKGK